MDPISSLPAPAPRQPIHTRAVEYRGFARDDGLFDIEGELKDTKPFAFSRSDGMHEAGRPIHHMLIRATVDGNMTIQAIQASMASTPFGECQQGVDPMQAFVGLTMGPGWRQAIERHLGGVRGCTHLRELLFNMATAAYQSLPAWREHQRRQSGEVHAPATEPPYHLGRCIAWDFEGPLVARKYPQFAGPAPARRVPLMVKNPG